MDDSPPAPDAPAANLPGYAELHCISHFSFLRGASSPESLVAQAVQCGYHAIAITDECSMAGIVRAHTEARAQRITLLIGTEMRVSPEDGTPFRLVLLAQDRIGYGNLCERITHARMRAPKGQYLVRPGDLIQTPGCLVILVPDACVSAEQLDIQVAWLARHFSLRAWVGISRLHRSGEARLRLVCLQTAARHGLPCVAIGQVEMHRRSRKALHDVLAAIRLRQSVAQCGYALASNAEQHLRTRVRLAQLYPPALLAETVRIADRCAFSLDELRYEYPDEIVPAGYTPASYLREQTWEGAARRYPQGVPDVVSRQILHELDLIDELRYQAYFLTVYDLVRFARERGILCQGRGSAANSAVCYCLGITEVNPANGNALFERFISRERNEPPDIDVDFEHHRREEVIQYLYQRYGRQRAALTGVVVSYRPRSVLRDTGRALGIDADIIEKVAKSHQWWDGKQALMSRLTSAGLDPEAPVSQHWAELAQALMGFPRHLSQHPGGFVLARGLLSRLVPIENAAMSGRSVVQWDKDDLDAIGLLKVDVLALGMLSVIQRALAWVAWRRDLPQFRLQDIPDDDAPTYDMICAADTVGVFQIESRAQMTMLPRLQPRQFYDLVIEVAIVRPGPIQGGMVHPYLRRRQGLEPVTYPSQSVRQVLERTLGVPIFQEQVMKIAMVAAGFTAGQADELRRSMAAWRRKGGVDKFRHKLVGGLLAHGYTSEFAEAIFRQIEGFGEYGFPESHAASFALLAYASAWLKRHEPEAFLAALLNAQPMGFYSPAQLTQDARRHGVRILGVDVRDSDWECQLRAQPGQARPAVRIGLNQILGLGQAWAERIVQARQTGPPSFADVRDLALRASLDQRALNLLADAGALQGLAGHRHLASWTAAAAVPSGGLLREAPIREDSLPALSAPSEGQDIVADYRRLGFTLGRHPLALLRTQLSKLRFAPAEQLASCPNGRLARACGLVTMRQRPQTAQGVIFMTIEDETGVVNVIVRPELATRQRRELLHAPLLAVIGTWQNVQGVRHLLAGRFEDHSHLLGVLNTTSRNFH
ncbi:MAG: error-prone DNA polymerase [Burkholderiaceae bacterium]|nr:error-prone DNA polymerase [Burkholderiaceae bacterium]